MQKSWSHWTRHGVFEIKLDFKLGLRVYDLYYNGKFIETFLSDFTVIRSIQDGVLDNKLGLSGADLEVPSSLKNWNNLK